MKPGLPLLLMAVLLPLRSIAAEVDLDALLERSWRVDHFRGFDTLLIGYRKRPDMVLLSQGPRSGTRIDTERLIQLKPGNPRLEAQDLVLFKSGKLRGTGILVDDHGPGKPMQIRMWLPALRKVRRFSEPDPDDIWGGSHLTYGDLYLRRPEDETHRRVEAGPFPACLEDAAAIGRWANRRLDTVLEAWCGLKGRPLLWVESRPRTPSPRYDRRLRLIDAETGAEYQSEYFIGERLVKRLQKNWQPLLAEQPESQVYTFWSVRLFGDDGVVEAESLAWVPLEAYEANRKLPDSLWSEKTLRRIRR